MLTPKEEKLLALALDQAAQPGEWATAGMKLLQSLRERGVDGFDSGVKSNIGKQAGKPEEPKTSKTSYSYHSKEHLAWPGSIVMSFGKHKGKPLAQIDPGYFSWCVENLDQTRDAYLINAMKWMLEELKSKHRR